MKNSSPPTDPLERFASYVTVGEGCWPWSGELSRGYGVFRPEPGRRVRAHRWLYALIYGEIPPELECDHLCANPICVKPDHIEPVTHRVNSLRGVSPPARNATKTHCRRGHELTPENTYTSSGRHQRKCRICYREEQKRTRRAQRAANPRVRRGEAHNQAKLTWEQVREIRRLKADGLTYVELQSRYGISGGTLWAILKGKHWIESPEIAEAVDE